MELKVVKVDTIIIGERFRKEMGDIDQLALSFKKEGIISPLAMKDNGDGTYTLLAGGRRIAAAQKAGFKDVPARIYPQELTELEMRSIELMENLERKEMNWVEAAKLKAEIHRLQLQIHGQRIIKAPDAPGASIQTTADLMGISRQKLSADIQMAEALDIYPELANAKNQADATKKFGQLKEQLVKEVLAKKMEQQLVTTPIDRIRAGIASRYIVGDFLKVVGGVEDRSIDFCEVDPPYGINLKAQKESYGKNYIHGDYNEIDAEGYLDFMRTVLQQCYRVMTENSWLALWFGPDPWFEPLYQLLIDTGFKTSRLHAIWYKGGTGQTLQPDQRLASCYEAFFYARKGNPPIVKQGRSNVFHFRPVPPDKKIHPTERPIELLQEILSTFCQEGSRILVPFAGSGNTLLAAANLGMPTVGTDLTQAYRDAYVVRVHEGVPTRYLSYRKGNEENL